MYPYAIVREQANQKRRYRIQLEVQLLKMAARDAEKATSSLDDFRVLIGKSRHFFLLLTNSFSLI
jgi:hypothetical protein